MSEESKENCVWKTSDSDGDISIPLQVFKDICMAIRYILNFRLLLLLLLLFLPLFLFPPSFLVVYFIVVVTVLLLTLVHLFRRLSREKLCSFLRESNLKDREDKWKKHIMNYVSKTIEPDKAVGRKKRENRENNARMEFLGRHLDILDSKYGVLLTFLSILGAVTGILASHSSEGIYACMWLIYTFYTLWGTSVLICLLYDGSFYWGELKGDTSGEFIKHVDQVTTQLIKRTMMYRVAWVLTIATVIVFLFIARNIILEGENNYENGTIKKYNVEYCDDKNINCQSPTYNLGTYILKKEDRRRG